MFKGGVKSPWSLVISVAHPPKPELKSPWNYYGISREHFFVIDCTRTGKKMPGLWLKLVDPESLVFGGNVFMPVSPKVVALK